MRRFIGPLAAFFLLWVPVMAGQSQPESKTTAMSGPPKVLQIFREEVKPGKGAEHEKVEAGWPRAFSKANWPTHYLAMTSLTGAPEAWFVTGYSSLGAWEKDGDAMDKTATLKAETDRLAEQDGQLLSGARGLVAVYRPEMSYRATINVATMRYFRVVTFAVRPGHTEEFVESRKLAKAAHEKANVDDHYAVFEVVAGAPLGTYLLLVPMKSLGELDEFDQLHGTAYKEAMGREGEKKMNELSSAAVLRVDSTIFAFSPKMSYVSQEWVAANPDFWAPKTAVAKAAPANKGVQKAVKKQ